MSETKFTGLMCIMVLILFGIYGALVVFSNRIVADSRRDNVQLAILASEIKRLDIETKLLMYNNDRQDTMLNMMGTLLGNAQNMEIRFRDECAECH